MTKPGRAGHAIWGLLGLLAFPAAAQEAREGTTDRMRDQGGISTPLLSRCAGKFGADLREGDQAFPGFTLLGAPWLNVANVEQTLDGAKISTIVSGIGGRNRRRGEVVALRFRCLIDDKGVAVRFEDAELLPSGRDQLPPAMTIRGVASYPKTQLAPGSELRLQLVDQDGLLTEAVVRSSWVNPIPFALRLPPDMNLTGRKLAIQARLSLGATTLFRLQAPVPLVSDHLQQPINLTLVPVTPDSVR